MLGSDAHWPPRCHMAATLASTQAAILELPIGHVSHLDSPVSHLGLVSHFCFPISHLGSDISALLSAILARLAILAQSAILA